MGPGGLYSFILCMAALSVLHQYESFKRLNRVHIVLITAGHVFVLVTRRTITNTRSCPGATINAITDRTTGGSAGDSPLSIFQGHRQVQR